MFNFSKDFGKDLRKLAEKWLFAESPIFRYVSHKMEEKKMGGSTLGGRHGEAYGNPIEAEPRAKTIAELDREECDAAGKMRDSASVPFVPKEDPSAGGPAGVVIAESKVTPGGLIENPDGAWVYENPEDEPKPMETHTGEQGKPVLITIPMQEAKFLSRFDNPESGSPEARYLNDRDAKDFIDEGQKSQGPSIGSKAAPEDIYGLEDAPIPEARLCMIIENQGLWKTCKLQGDRIKELEAENQGFRVELQDSKDATLSTVNLLQAEKVKWAQEREGFKLFAQQGVAALTRKEVERVEKERDHWKKQAEGQHISATALQKSFDKMSALNATLIHGIIRLMELLRNLEEK